MKHGAIARLGGVVLCGGRSERMGSAKAWLDFAGETLLQRVVRRVAEVASPVVVVASPGQEVPPLPAEIAIVRDEVEGRGPLQGIAAGLGALADSKVEAAFVSSTDVPFLHPALIRRLAALRGEAYDIAVPRAQGGDHPLSAVYAIRARVEIAALLAEDRRRVSLLFERMRTLFAEEASLLADPALAAADPALRSLRNVNTKEEYDAALAEAETSA